MKKLKKISSLLFPKKIERKPLSYGEYKNINAVQLSLEFGYRYYGDAVLKKYIAYLQFFGVDVNGEYGQPGYLENKEYRDTSMQFIGKNEEGKKMVVRDVLKYIDLQVEKYLLLQKEC